MNMDLLLSLAAKRSTDHHVELRTRRIVQDLMPQSERSNETNSKHDQRFETWKEKMMFQKELQSESLVVNDGSDG